MQDYLQDAKNYQQAGNAEMAFQQYMVAARDYGHPEAQFEVARCYQNGTGVEKTKKMRSCGTKGRRAGRCRGTVRAGRMCYYQTLGVEKRRQRGPQVVRSGGDSGNVTAQYMTGRLYAALSYNVPAVKWYTKAAEQECPEAQYELGACYEAGDGVGKDEAKAAGLYRKAAVQGLCGGTEKLGDCYTHGIGVAKDLEQAFECYSKAAKQGNVKAQYNLGLCYMKGNGVTKDPVQAVEWYEEPQSRDLQRHSISWPLLQ